MPGVDIYENDKAAGTGGLFTQKGTDHGNH
nr:MAG TPA: hypothetical protein [Caudoviricetes sp.]